ncbi:KCND2 [Mytilus edulis]|uniref:KCND2 n=1 Tax=Mytilus edulis TaxID=6550 RepID=A0A8S3RHC0_MYTED|nr:KCND2 [Mytilus edulis]
MKPDSTTQTNERFPMPDDSTTQTYITDDFIPNRTFELIRDIVHQSFLPGQISSKLQSFYSNAEENVISALYYMTNSFFILDVLCRIVCSPNLKTILTDILIMFDIFITLCAIVWYTLQVYDYHLDYLLYVQIFRVLGLFRILQHIHAFKVLGYTLNFSKRDLLALMMYVCVVIIIMSNFLYFVENTNDFTSIPETWWYTVVTMTTLGYGDMVPATVVGKIIGALSVIIGFLLFSLIIPIMATRFMTLYDMTDIDDFNLGEKEAKEECVQLKSV